MTPIVLDNADAHVEFLHYPPTGSLARGEPWLLRCDILRDGNPLDVTGWTWHATIRATPDSDPTDAFDVSSGHNPRDTPTPCRVLLTLPAERTRTIPNGAVLALEQLTPEPRQWWTAALRVSPDVSH